MRLITLTILSLCCATATAADQPNILWITAEDMSATLGCYGDTYATSPNIDALAKESVRYTHAFATAPVCSPSRSTLITGCYATSLGTHQMRSAFPIPNFIKGFPSYLREAGYFTTNNVKTDYNTANEAAIIEASWDVCSPKAHWRDRAKKDQPFFSVFNLMTTHQSRTMVWPREQFIEEVQSGLAEEEIHDAAKAPLPPYYPDTPIIRRTVARYYDCVTAMDKEVGEILQQLADDGLAENTIVFFYSDHGSGMPRHKRCLYDSGMHVPLLIRFPKKWKHLAPKKAGETTDRLVSFVDFGPTVLSLAEVAIPDYMQGEPFLGKADTKPREYVFGHRDRVDEVIDMSRSVRTKRYLYIRNYMPHLGWNQRSAWTDQSEIAHEFYRLTDRKTMTVAQWQFAGPTRTVDEFYDCERDPDNIYNLASMRTRQEDDAAFFDMQLASLHHLKTELDLGLIAEPDGLAIARDRNLFEAARDSKFKFKDLIAASFAVGFRKDPIDYQRLTSTMSVRYWGAIGVAQRDELSDITRKTLALLVEDDRSSDAVWIVIAQALAQHGERDKGLSIMTKRLKSDDLTTVLYAARAIELLGDDAKAAIPAMEQALARAEKILPPDTPAGAKLTADQDMAMFIGFSTRAFLQRVRGDDEVELDSAEQKCK